MPVLISPGMLKELRFMHGSTRPGSGALAETYTRTSIVAVTDGNGDPILDAWGQQLTEAGPPVAGLPCRLRHVESVLSDDRGALVVRRPTLWVRHDDPLTVGDTVTEVRDGEGQLLLARAAVVQFEPAPVGPGAVTRAVGLEGAEAVPLPAPGGA